LNHASAPKTSDFFNSLLRHRQNIRGSVDVFLKEYHLSLPEFKNVRPLVLYCLPGLFSSTSERSENHHGFALLNHLTRCELREFQVLAYLREKISNLGFPPKRTCPGKLVAGTRADPDTGVIEQVAD
jgi:hypothetical protein